MYNLFMLRENSSGSIIGIIISVIALFILLSIATKYMDSDSNSDTASPSAIDEAQQTTDEANGAGERASSILNGLTGN